MDPRRRGVWPVGGRRAPGCAIASRASPGGFLVDRRPQMAQRPLRLRARLRPGPGGAPRGDEARARRTYRSRPRATSATGTLGPRAVAPGSRLRGLRGAPVAWPDGVVELVERCCSWPGGSRTGCGRAPGVTVLNEVVLNQVPRPLPAAGRRRRRRVHAGGDRGRAGRWNLLARRHRLARVGSDADLRLELEHDRTGRGSVGRGDPPLRPGGGRDLVLGWRLNSCAAVGADRLTSRPPRGTNERQPRRSSAPLVRSAPLQRRPTGGPPWTSRVRPFRPTNTRVAGDASRR